jgi:heat shock protein HtpX
VGAAKVNRRRALLLTIVPAAVVAAIFVVLGIVAIGLVVGIVIAVVALGLGIAAYLFAPRALASRLETVPANPDEHARLYNVVEGLCLAWGLPQPELRLLVDPAPNAIAIGRSPDDSVIICTTGLVDSLDRMELEAVLAHELAHVRNLDVLSGSVAANTIGYLALMSPRAGIALLRRSGAARESYADRASVGLTRYPPAMISALEKTAAAPSRLPAGVSRSVAVRTGQLWLAPFDAGVPLGYAGREAPPGAAAIPGSLSLDERIELLREL